MKKDTPYNAPHPVDAYFRDQEANIPLGMEDAHWAALQAMLKDSKQPKDVPGGNNAPDVAANMPGSSAIRLLGFFAIILLFCSVTLVLVANRQPNTEPATTDILENAENSSAVEVSAGQQKPDNPAQKSTGQFGEMDKEPEVATSSGIAPSTTGQVGQTLIDSVHVHSSTVLEIALPDSLKAPVTEQLKKEIPAKSAKKKHLAW